MRARRERKGVTAVLVVMITVVLMGMAAFAVDLSQMWAYQSELQRSADAAAHAGAVELIKPGFDTADSVATAYANSNPAEGENPTVDSIEYGNWNPVDTTFTSLCKAPCNAATAAGANALRVSLSGGPGSTIFSQFAGSDSPANLKVSAIAWVAPTTARHDCTKPLAVKYMALTNYLQTIEGRAGLDSERVLDSIDLATLRAGPSAVGAMCLTTNTTDQCAPTAPAALLYPSSYVPVQQFPPATEGPDPYLTELEEPCAATEALGPLDALDIDLAVPPVGDTQTGTDSWCELYGAFPCLMKLNLWDTTTAVAGTVATDGNTCAVGTCKSIHTIVPFIITAVTESGVMVGPVPNVNAAVQGYPILGIDEAAIADTAGAISRIVLVH